MASRFRDDESRTQRVTAEAGENVDDVELHPSRKDGDVPRAYSPAFENVIAERGLHMEEMKGRALVSEDSKRMCRQLLQAEYEAPQHTSYPLTEFLAVWDQIRTRNESKIFRDLAPRWHRPQGSCSPPAIPKWNM